MNYRASSFMAAFLAATIIGCSKQSPDHATKTNRTSIYDESANGDKQVADAVVIARREHKRILLQFGANWCGWCRRLHKLFESDKSVSEELRADYIVVLIDVNKEHNKDLVVKYGAETDYGLPFLVVLDSDGTHLITKHSDDFEEGDHHNPQKVLAFLKAPLMPNDPKQHNPIENPGAIRDEISSRQIAMSLLEMHHRWAANDYHPNGMTVPKLLTEQGQVSGSAAGILGAYVEYNYQKDGVEWSRRFHILRADTNAKTWILSEAAAPKDTNLLRMAWQHKLITVTGEP
jgi:thiol-disulfide isomerase/thioredoxin